MRPVIIVMVKAPLPGLAKTRLTPPLTPSESASLALCFVQDVVRSALGITGDVIVAFTSPEGREILQASLPSSLRWVEQQGETLDERLNAAIAFAYTLGFSPIVVLGADSPTLPQTFIQQACESLSEGPADVALGPTSDGGYYLVGVRKPEPELFRNVTWSSSFTFAQTAQNIEQLGLRLVTLEQWYDVDAFEDLKQLHSELHRDNNARLLAPATHNWLLTHNISSLND